MMIAWVRSHRSGAIYFAAVFTSVVIATIFLAWIISRVDAVADEVDQGVAAAEARDEAVGMLAGDVETLRDQLLELGEIPDAPPPDERVDDLPPIPGPEGPTGEIGRPGRPPTAAEISAAVTAYLTANPPPAGEIGERGPGPTTEQISAAVTAYFVANPVVAGPIGPAGPQGEPGADSTVPGPAGPAGVDGQPPTSWTFDIGGRTWVCTRSDPFNFEAPTYTCDIVKD